MNTIKLGDLVLYKTHAYAWAINPVKISGNALFTPPIMVVDQLTFNNANKDILSKVRCRFYNSTNNRVEEEWFNVQELSPFNRFERVDLDTEYEEFGRYTLRSCIYELQKLKTIFQIESSQNKSYATSILNHLPPVFIVTGKASISAKGNLKIKDYDSVGYKVKWFNPDTGKFKEEILPSIILEKLAPIDDLSFIEEAIKDKWIFQYNLPKPIEIQTTNDPLLKSLFRITDIRYNHLSIIVTIFDIVLNKEIEMSVEEFMKLRNQETKFFSDYFIDKYPKLSGDIFIYPHDIKLEIGLIYGITYLNAQDVKSTRCIIVLRKLEQVNESEHDNGELVEAFCLLKCEIRYFWTKRILQLYKSNYKVF